MSLDSNGHLRPMHPFKHVSRALAGAPLPQIPLPASSGRADLPGPASSSCKKQMFKLSRYAEKKTPRALAVVAAFVLNLPRFVAHLRPRDVLPRINTSTTLASARHQHPASKSLLRPPATHHLPLHDTLDLGPRRRRETPLLAPLQRVLRAASRSAFAPAPCFKYGFAAGGDRAALASSQRQQRALRAALRVSFLRAAPTGASGLAAGGDRAALSHQANGSASPALLPRVLILRYNWRLRTPRVLPPEAKIPPPSQNANGSACSPRCFTLRYHALPLGRLPAAA
ncbi:hypothetical protein MKEN_00728900 [Mycena kentingensis (nom. inval.)]|nr:hypothetical protein MKEN_00728900 [Mycena kentingensis (nom. inval.)]